MASGALASNSSSSSSELELSRELDYTWKAKDVKCWTVEDVKNWLLALGFKEEAVLFSKEKISGEALLAIEKNDIKDIGVQPMGRRIELMAKIKEVIKTQEQGHHAEVESKLEDSSQKRKITTLDKKAWDAKSKTKYLEKTSFIVREAAKVWPGNGSVHFKNNPTQNLKLEELVSLLEQTCTIPKIGFGRECIRSHIIQWAHEKNRRIKDGYDYLAEHTPAKRAKKPRSSADESNTTEDEPDFGPGENSSVNSSSSRMEDISTKSAVIVVLTFLGVQSMQDVTVVRHLHPLAKKLSVKYRSLGKYQLSTKLAKALLSQGFVEVKSTMEDGEVNFLNLKRENVVCKKKLDQVKSNDADVEESDNSGDTDSVATDSSFSTHSDGFDVTLTQTP
ncbi:uncharacterized protein LOC144661207 [Oculina patagonica]